MSLDGSLAGSLDEMAGRAVLRERFVNAGYAIVEDFPFAEGAVRFSADGFDPQARVGYEYITTAAGDRKELTPEMLAELEARLGRGELFILLIDERDVSGPEVLQRAADRFLSEVRSRRAGG